MFCQLASPAHRPCVFSIPFRGVLGEGVDCYLLALTSAGGPPAQVSFLLGAFWRGREERQELGLEPRARELCEPRSLVEACRPGGK